MSTATIPTENHSQRDVTQGKTLIYFHIPKTAGTTLSMIVRRHFPSDAFMHINVTVNPQFLGEFINLPEKKRGEIRYLEGHMPFGLHEYLPCPSTYVTMLRDPVDRVISEYYDVFRVTTTELYKEVTSKNMNLQDYVRNYAHCDTSSGVSNHQTRCISGVQWGHLLPGSTSTSGNILEIAKANLREHFIFGLTERFDESLILLKRALGWRTKDILYVKRNVGMHRPPQDAISAETIEFIADHNELDIQLYEFARQLFEERISQQDSSFRRELQIFRLRNRLYNLIMNVRGGALLLALVRRGMPIGFALLRAGIGKVKAVGRKR